MLALQALHSDEWSSLCERIELTAGHLSLEGLEQTEAEQLGKLLTLWSKVSVRTSAQAFTQIQ